MRTEKINEIMKNTDANNKRVAGPNGILANWFRTITNDLGIVSPVVFNKYLNDFVVSSRKGMPNNKYDQTSVRGNLSKELTRRQMTWKVFCKALRVLKILEIRIVIYAKHPSGRETVHSTKVFLGGRYEEFDNALEQPEEIEPVIDVPWALNKDEKNEQ